MNGDEQIITAREYDQWIAQNTLSARWIRFWLSPRCTLWLNTPARKLPRRLALSSEDRILDIGCGYAGLLIYLYRKVEFTRTMEGLDCSPLMVQKAQEELRARDLHHRSRIRQGLATRLPYPDKTFDAIFCTYVIKHLSDGALRLMFREVHRVLRPGGRFCLWEAAPSRFKFMHSFNMRLMDTSASPVRLRNPRQVREALHETGFRDILPFGNGFYLYYPPLPRTGFIAYRPQIEAGPEDTDRKDIPHDKGITTGIPGHDI